MDNKANGFRLMNLYMRLVRVLLSALLKQRIFYTEAIESRFRVWLHDIDLFGHMNNGRYLQIMDVARADWMIRTGVARTIRKNRWAPLLGGGFIRFRHSLHFLQTFRVRTRLLGWDHRWFFLEHVFLDRKGRCVAKGISRAALRSEGAWVCTTRVAQGVHPDAIQSPELPDHVPEWLRLEERMFRHRMPDDKMTFDGRATMEYERADPP